jgi:hypothetical protein
MKEFLIFDDKSNISLFTYSYVLDLESNKTFSQIVGYKFNRINKITDQIKNGSVVIKINNTELLISADNPESVQKITDIIMSKKKSFDYDNKPESWNFDDPKFEYLKNNIIDTLTSVPTLSKLKWINNMFDNIFEHDMFIDIIKKNNYYSLDLENKKVNVNVLNPEDEEIININQNIKLIIREPKYTLENLVIIPPIKNHITLENLIIPPTEFNIDASEFVPNYNEIDENRFIPSFLLV